MNTLLKNFWNVLNRYRTSSFLNITGLAVAFASFLIIIIQVRYEWNFDTYHSKADRIFRVDMPRHIAGDLYASVLTRGFLDRTLELSPHIEGGTLLSLFYARSYVTIGEGDNQRGFNEHVATCYPDIVKIFDFKMIEGDANCLNDPEKILIPQSMAHRMFGSEPAVGKTVRPEEFIWTKSDVQVFTIGGVYADFPENTQLNNVIYARIDKTGIDDWGSQNYLGYVVLDSPDSKEAVEESVNSHIDYEAYDKPVDTRMELIPLTDIYFRPGQLSDFTKTGNPFTTKLLFLIALLVIAIACINFVNFSTALAPVRMKSINTRKVLGSSVATLRTSLIFEAVGMCFIAGLLAVLIVFILDKTQFLSFITADLSLLNNLPMVVLLFAISILLGLIAGIYPSWYMTSFPPALVLKGNFGLSPAGRKLRTALIGFQFIVSIGLIVCSLFIQLQNRYIQSYNTGYNKNHIVLVNIGSKLYNESGDLYRQQLMNHSGIEDVAFSDQIIGSSDSYSAYNQNYRDQDFNTYTIHVSWNFLNILNVPVIGGRNFNESDGRNDSTAYYIYNAALQERYQMESGDLLDPSWRGREQIVGFVDNLKLTSLRFGEDNISFIVKPGVSLPYSYIRLKEGANIPETVGYIRNTVAQIAPSFPFNLDFYDTYFAQLYKQEESLNKMVAAFSVLAIILSLVGVFGLVVFETEYRRKEIGVRKVFGASTASIMLAFNRTYFRIICICFVIATPVAYYFVSNWLESFFYRTPIYWWVFAIAFLIVTFITICTVSFQNWQAANANPVDSIKSE